jgi:hypothetical protein
MFEIREKKKIIRKESEGFYFVVIDGIKRGSIRIPLVITGNCSLQYHKKYKHEEEIGRRVRGAYNATARGTKSGQRQSTQLIMPSVIVVGRICG